MAKVSAVSELLTTLLIYLNYWAIGKYSLLLPTKKSKYLPWDSPSVKLKKRKHYYMQQFLNAQNFPSLKYPSGSYLFFVFLTTQLISFVNSTFSSFRMKFNVQTLLRLGLVWVVSQLSWPIICLVSIISVGDIVAFRFLSASTEIYLYFFTYSFCPNLIFSPFFFFNV